MRWTLSLLSSVFFVGMVLAIGTEDADTAKKLIGVWEVTKSDTLPPGVMATVEFTKDSKIKLRMEQGEKKLAADGTYKVKTGTIITEISFGGKSKSETNKIKKLTDTELILEDDKGKIDEYKKKKAS